MDETQLHLARTLFRGRIDSLRNDVMRCFWPISNTSAADGTPAPAIIYRPPQYAPFPAMMYCCARIDYFSSFWEGWNDSNSPNRPADRNQNKRMTDFLCKFVGYPRREAVLAINVWRHKLMHTSEPRIVRSTEPRAYLWAVGVGGSCRVGEVEAYHMRLEELPATTKDPNRSLLYFDCHEFVHDLDEGVFGPTGYFTALLNNANYEPPSSALPPPAPPPATRTLQQNYTDCYAEMEGYKIDFSKVGL